MKPNEDRLDVLRKKYLKAVDYKLAEIDAIRRKISILDELSAEADTLNMPEMPVATPPKNADENGHAFSPSGLTDSVLGALTAFGTKHFTPPQMRDHLLKNGFKPKGKNFGVSVGTTLKRLAAKSKNPPIVKEELNGKTLYRAKP
jgi:hypothetical protein